MKKITSVALLLVFILMPVTQAYAINFTDYMNAMARRNRAPQVLGDSATNVLFKTTATVNVRTTPSTSGVIAGQQPAGVIAAVVPGTVTVSANGYMWVNLDFTSGADGWVVLNYLSEYTTTSDTDTFIKNLPATIAAYQKITADPSGFKKDAENIAGKLTSGESGWDICIPNNFGQVNTYSWEGEPPHWVWQFTTDDCPVEGTAAGGEATKIVNTYNLNSNIDIFLSNLPKTIELYQSILNDPESYKEEVAKGLASIPPQSTTEKTKYYYYCASNGNVLLFTNTGGHWGTAPVVLVGPGLESMCGKTIEVRITDDPSTMDVDTAIKTLTANLDNLTTYHVDMSENTPTLSTKLAPEAKGTWMVIMGSANGGCVVSIYNSSTGTWGNPGLVSAATCAGAGGSPGLYWVSSSGTSHILP